MDVLRLPLFKLGIGFLVAGIFWLCVIFFEGDRISDEFSLKPASSTQVSMNLQGKDVGYYKIFMPEFDGGGVFVQVLDQNYNVISDGIVETKMSVGYFDYPESGMYSLKITNLSENQIGIELEYGETNASQMNIPGVITLSGGLILVIATFFKLKNYRIAQPDEKIS